MLNTRLINDWLGTSYSIEEVAEMDSLLIDILGALRQGLNPTKGKVERAEK